MSRTSRTLLPAALLATFAVVGGALSPANASPANATARPSTNLPAAVAAEIPAGVPVTAPVVTGEAAYGQTLSLTPGTWNPAPTAVSYQWTRDGVPIPGATATTYEIGFKDIGHALAVIETTTDATGAVASATSAPTLPVIEAQFELRRAPKVAGAFKYAQVLRLDRIGKVKPAATSTRVRWTRDGQPIGKGKRLRLGVGDVGRFVAMEVTYRAKGYEPFTYAVEKKVGHRVGVRRTFTYSVTTRGQVSASMKAFRAQAQQTFSDPRGWRGAGYAFKPVPRGGDFTLVLSTAGLVPSFSSGCSSSWSCRVGRYVIINQTRWQHASPAWNAGRRSLRDYRHMVVNHETGHWLGHGHASCGGKGPAPVMMQQSKGTGGCSFNPWPLPRERWTSR